jgi:hypothetical protein
MSEPLTDVVDWETTDRWLFGEAEAERRPPERADSHPPT